MHDWGFFLLVIGVLLTVVTLVGHGIWVLLATLCRAVSDTPIPPRRKCVFCGRDTSAEGSRCDWCGRGAGRSAGRGAGRPGSARAAVAAISPGECTGARGGEVPGSRA